MILHGSGLDFVSLIIPQVFDIVEHTNVFALTSWMWNSMTIE